MTHDSAADAREAVRLVNLLQDEVLGLGARWKLYRALYDSAPAPLDYWGPSVSVFHLLQATLFEDIVLRLCRVTEQAESPWPTASIFKLARLLETVDPAASAHLTPVLANLENAVAPLRDERNNRLAHASAAPRDSDVARLRRGHVEKALALLLKAVRIADRALTGRQLSPDDVLIPMEGDAVALVELLRRNSVAALP